MGIPKPVAASTTQAVIPGGMPRTVNPNRMPSALSETTETAAQLDPLSRSCHCNVFPENTNGPERSRRMPIRMVPFSSPDSRIASSARIARRSGAGSTAIKGAGALDRRTGSHHRGTCNGEESRSALPGRAAADKCGPSPQVTAPDAISATEIIENAKKNGGIESVTDLFSDNTGMCFSFQCASQPGHCPDLYVQCKEFPALQGLYPMIRNLLRKQKVDCGSFSDREERMAQTQMFSMIRAKLESYRVGKQRP